MTRSLFAFASVLLMGAVLAGFAGPREDAAPTPASAATLSEVATWSLDQAHSRVGFKVKHLGISTVRGAFSEYDGTVRFDPADLSTLSARTTVQVASIDTENERRDNHLRSADFFAADEFPAMTFVSKRVQNIEGDRFELVGDLTIRGTTKEVVFDGEFLGVAAMGESERAGFEASTTIDRLDYGLAWDRLTEAGGLVVSHDVTIVLELQLRKETPQTDAD